MFMCLRLTSGQTSSRNICLKSALSIPIAFALIAAMWIYDYTRELMTSTVSFLRSLRQRVRKTTDGKILVGFCRFMAMVNISTNPRQFIDSYINKKIKIILIKRAESGRLHLMASEVPRNERYWKKENNWIVVKIFGEFNAQSFSLFNLQWRP